MNNFDASTNENDRDSIVGQGSNSNSGSNTGKQPGQSTPHQENTSNVGSKSGSNISRPQSTGSRGDQSVNHGSEEDDKSRDISKKDKLGKR